MEASKINKFWLRSPIVVKDGKKTGNQPITLVGWTSHGEPGNESIIYATATCNPLPSKKTGKKDTFNRQQAHREVEHKLLRRGHSFQVVPLFGQSTAEAICKHILTVHPGSLCRRAAKSYLFGAHRGRPS